MNMLKRFGVKGMDCGGCSATLTAVLKRVPGVSAVRVDLKARSVEVEWDEKRANEKDLLSAIAGAGYEVS